MKKGSTKRGEKRDGAKAQSQADEERGKRQGREGKKGEEMRRGRLRTPLRTVYERSTWIRERERERERMYTKRKEK